MQCDSDRRQQDQNTQRYDSGNRVNVAGGGEGIQTYGHQHGKILEKILYGNGTATTDGVVPDILQGGVDGDQKYTAGNTGKQQDNPCVPYRVDKTEHRRVYQAEQQNHESHSIGCEPGPAQLLQLDEPGCYQRTDDDTYGNKQGQC